MARMKDIKFKCENKLNILKEKFRLDKPGEQPFKLPYDTSQTLNNISVTKDFCSEVRRIGSFGLVTYSINEDDKKTKRKTLNSLAELFNETSSKLSEGDPKRGPLNFGALAFAEIMSFTSLLYKTTENNIIHSLNDLEKMCTEIQELDKKVHSLKRDIANLQSKYEEQVNVDEQKSQLMRDQIINAQNDCDNLTELYLQRIFAYEAATFQNAEVLHEIILLRTEYHEKCAKSLMKILPQCNSYMEEKRTPVSFGTPLENHLRETKRFIAYPLEYCVKALSDVNFLQQEGLFRVSGSMNKANLLCSILNLMKTEDVSIDWPPHVVADALKRYLREMPVSLLGKINHSEWEKCFEMSKKDNKQKSYQKIKELLGQLPKSYYQNIEYLIRFLNLVVREKSYNLMGISNICMVFVPNLFKPSATSLTLQGLNIENNVHFNYVLESLLQDTNYFFPHSDQSEKKKSCEDIAKSVNQKDEYACLQKCMVTVCKRSNSAVEQYLKAIQSDSKYESENEKLNLSRSQRRRQELQINPVNFEMLEKEIVDINLENDLQSGNSVPPVPPRLKIRKT